MPARFQPTEITLREVAGANLMVLVAPVTFTDEGGRDWTAPAGTLTDGASVPRLALPVSDGRFDTRFLKAAVVHDAYCQKDNMGRNPPFQSQTWRDTHRMFHAACLAGGTPRGRARAMFAAVWYGGPRWGDPVYEARQAPPDLAMIGLSETRRWISAEAPDLAQIEADVERREVDVVHVHGLQMAALRAVQDGDLQLALDRLSEAEATIDDGLASAPDDLMFRNLRAYQHKNWAIIRPDQADDRLGLAEEMFRGIIDEDPLEPSALNGLGSVELMRGNTPGARSLIERALEIEPDYAAARHDLDQVEALERGQ